MTRLIRWESTTLGHVAAEAGAALEDGASSRRRIDAFLPAGASALAGVHPDSRLDRFTLVAIPASVSAQERAASLAAAASMGAAALVEGVGPVPAGMTVLRTVHMAESIARLAAARRAASRARVLAVLGISSRLLAQPLLAAMRRRWRTAPPAPLEETLLSLAPATERAVVASGAGDLVSLVADLALCAPSLLVLSPPRPGDLGPLELASTLPASVTVIHDEADPRAGLLRHAATCRLTTPAELGCPAEDSAVLRAAPARASFACRGLTVSTTLASSLRTEARLAAAAALLAGTDPLDIAEAFARVVPSSMPRRVPGSRVPLAPYAVPRVRVAA